MMRKVSDRQVLLLEAHPVADLKATAVTGVVLIAVGPIVEIRNVGIQNEGVPNDEAPGVSVARVDQAVLMVRIVLWDRAVPSGLVSVVLRRLVRYFPALCKRCSSFPLFSGDKLKGFRGTSIAGFPKSSPKINWNN